MKNLKLFQDARDYQILFLGLFLVLGLSTRDWTIHWELMGVTIASCLLTQFVMALCFAPSDPQTTRIWASLNSLRSGLITALGLCLLLRANHYETMALAGVVAIASKFVFRYHKKHFFNPANIGIIFAISFTHDAWVSPGQWGQDWWYLLLFAGTGAMVLKKVGRFETSAAFFLTYGILCFGRNAYLGWEVDVVLHQLMSGSLLLFALFMLTDPRSIPNARTGRLVWAMAIAVISFVLQYYFYLNTAIFWTLFIMSPTTLLIDRYWNSPAFSWAYLLPQTKMEGPINV